MDYRVVEPSRLIVAARRDVRAVLRHEGGETFYFVEDPLRGRYYRLGAAEYELFAALDGARSVADAVAYTAAKLGAHAFTIEQAVALTKWLVDAGLAATETSTVPERVEGVRDRRRDEARRRWNPWFLRFSCGNPDSWLTKCGPIGNVLFHRNFFAAWCLLVVWACCIVVAHGSEMMSAVPIELGARGAAQLLTAWCLLKLVHETAHGLACRRFGGQVGSWGIAVIMGLPSPFIEVSSVWRLADKRQRIIVSLAGMYAELFIAALAVFVWKTSDDGVVRQTALAVAAVSGIATLLFNLNPLMRFDGYFAFSDWMEKPNLAASATDAVRRFVRYYLRGIDGDSPPTSPQPRWLLAYGLAAVAWRWSVAFGLLVLALSRFGGTATLLLSILPVTYGVTRFWRAVTPPRVPARGQKVNRRRLAWTYGSLAAAVALWIVAFDPRTIELPAVIEYEPLTIVRTATPGFVERVLVNDGDRVTAGQVLAVLVNKELETEVVQAENLVEQSLAKSWVHREAGEVAKEQAEAARRRGLETKWKELSKRREALQVRAPIDGQVVSRGLSLQLGRYLKEGDELAVVGNESRKEVIAAVAQAEAEFVIAPGDVATISLSGTGRVATTSQTALDPRADVALIHPAFSVEHGGPLPVVRREQASDVGQTTIAPEHVEPYLRLRGRLDEAQAPEIRAGRTGTLSVQTTWSGLLARNWTRLQRRVNEAFE